MLVKLFAISNSYVRLLISIKALPSLCINVKLFGGYEFELVRVGKEEVTAGTFL